VDVAPAADTIVATLGSATTGLRIRVAADGTAEIVIDTTGGRLGTVISFATIADGRPRVLGGYLTPTSLVATCDGYVMAITDLVSPALPAGASPQTRPEPPADSGLVRFDGPVEILQARSAG
jgi:hypothetical protein